MRIVFVTPLDMFGKEKNGGINASFEHLRMLEKIFGKDNIKIIFFSNYNGTYDCLNGRDCQMFKRLKGNMKLLIASLFSCRIYMPWEEKKVFNSIDEFSPDIVFFETSIHGRLCRKKVSYKQVVFFQNMEADYTFNKVKNEKWYYYPAYIAAKKNDKWACMADKVICFNNRDSERLNVLYGRKSDLNLPITFEDTFNEKKIKYTGNKELLFIGSLFGANQDGIEWFIKNVMPKLNDVSLTIVGLNFEQKKEEYEQYSNVHVIGTVDDIDEYYYKFPAVVMPIRYGAGMKVKTAEALMHGKHIFASDEALEGYDIEGICGVDRCNEVHEYQNAIKSFFDNYDSEYRYDSSSRKAFLEGYETNLMTKKLGDFLKRETYCLN